MQLSLSRSFFVSVFHNVLQQKPAERNDKKSYVSKVWFTAIQTHAEMVDSVQKDETDFTAVASQDFGEDFAPSVGFSDHLEKMLLFVIHCFFSQLPK